MDPPAIDAFGVIDQVYRVPAGTKSVKAPSTGVIANVDPVQIVVLTLATDMVGFTTTVIVNVAPVHPLIDGVTVYTTVLAVLVGFVKI